MVLRQVKLCRTYESFKVWVYVDFVAKNLVPHTLQLAMHNSGSASEFELKYDYSGRRVGKSL